MVVSWHLPVYSCDILKISLSNEDRKYALKCAGIDLLVWTVFNQNMDYIMPYSILLYQSNLCSSG